MCFRKMIYYFSGEAVRIFGKVQEPSDKGLNYGYNRNENELWSRRKFGK